MLYARHTQTSEAESLTVVLDDGETLVVSPNHPNYDSILTAITKPNARPDDTELRQLATQAGTAVTGELRRLSERVSLRDGSTILFDGTPMDKTITRHIVGMYKTGDPNWTHLVAFLENLATNPSEKSRRHLYHFITQHGLTITPAGHIVAYKGVRSDGRSIHAGPGIVDGVQMNDHLPNAVGSVIEIDRAAVDDDRARACSRGLHVGTFNYANDFGARLLTVTVNPRDVVSVPSDSNDQKVRVCRYRVEELAPHAPYVTLTLTTFGDVEFGDEDEFADDV